MSASNLKVLKHCIDQDDSAVGQCELKHVVGVVILRCTKNIKWKKTFGVWVR